jgi:hypothetical protein
MEMGGAADAGHDRAIQGTGGNALGPAPSRRIAPGILGAVTSKAKLTRLPALGALKHNAANGLGKGRMAQAIQYNLCHGSLA